MISKRGLNNGKPEVNRSVGSITLPLNSPPLKGGDMERVQLIPAFTLAEVLITLGIIGVVAAMTLQSLVSEKVEKERVTQLKKAYSTLSQAFITAVSENGTPNEWGMGDMDDEKSHYIMAVNMSKHMKLAQNCIDMDNADTIRKVCNPPAGFNNKATASNVVLLDGTSVSFRAWYSSCQGNFSKNRVNKALQHTCGMIIVDLNGNRLPNENGKDKFYFYLTRDAIVPWGIQDDALEFEQACNRKIDTPYPNFDGSKNMYSCAGWVLYNENLDYLKCDDLTWEGKSSCK